MNTIEVLQGTDNSPKSFSDIKTLFMRMLMIIFIIIFVELVVVIHNAYLIYSYLSDTHDYVTEKERRLESYCVNNYLIVSNLRGQLIQITDSDGKGVTCTVPLPVNPIK